MQPLTTPVHRPVHVEILQDDLRRVCGAFELEPMDGKGLIAGDVGRRGGAFDTAVVALDARHVRRCDRAIRRDPGEHLFLLIQDEGQCRVEQGGHAAVLSPGDMFLVDSVRPSAFVYDGRRSNQVSLHMPRTEMLHRFGRACTGGVPIGRSDPLWLAMRAVIERLLAGPDAPPQLREAFLSLVGAHLHTKQAQGPARPAETLLSRALAMIDSCCADSAFGPRELAGRLNVSERMLQRHFRALGETPGRRLLNRRLELAHARLRARGPDRACEGIAAIAYDAGFNDLSYFYREFRRKYGTTPGAAARGH